MILFDDQEASEGLKDKPRQAQDVDAVPAKIKVIGVGGGGTTR